MSVYERDKGGQLVPVEGEIPEEAITAIERADEQAIIEKITRIDAQPFFAYSYLIKTKEGAKEIIGISVDGAKEIARQLGNIKATTDIRVEEKDDYFYVILPVTDLIRNVTLLGVGRQSKYIIGEGMIPTDRIDETAFVKAISKAQRNGILAIADQLTIARIVDRLDTRAIKKLSAPPASRKALPPKAAKSEEKPEEKEIKSLRQQLHLKWNELQKADPEIGAKALWLKENYQVESSIELSLEQIREAVAKVTTMIEERAGPPAATIEEKRELVTELRNLEKRELVMELRNLGKTDKDIQTIFYNTGKKGGWTKEDLGKIWAEVNKLKTQTAGTTTEQEADEFLKEL